MRRLLFALVGGALALAVGCSDAETGAPPAADTGMNLDFGFDAQVADMAADPDMGLRAYGQPCTDADDCISGYCINTPTGGSVCSKLCGLCEPLGDFQLECRAIGIPFDVDVPDCTTDLVAPLQEFTEGNICTSCDKSYVGPVNVTDDSCAELLGDNAEPSPTELAFGFQFVSTQERVLWARDEAGVWAQAVTMTREGEGPWQWSSTSEIWDDPPDCNNGQQHLGDLTVTLTFTDP